MKIVKKILILFFTLVTIISVSGVVTYHHFCSTCKTDDYHLFVKNVNHCDIENTPDKCCEVQSGKSLSKCYDNEKDGCCKTENSFFKINLLFFNLHYNLSTDISEITLFISNNLSLEYCFFDDENFTNSSESPPKIICSLGLDIVNCQMII